MSKLIIAILKNSILPASLMIVGKVVGLFLTVRLFDFQMYLSNDIKQIFSIQVFFTDSNQTLIANSLSNGFMLILLAIGTFYLLIRHSIEVAATNDPRTIVKLVKYNILNWATSKNNTFLKALIWTLFLWAACLITMVSSISGTTTNYIALPAIVLMIVSAWRIIKTFELETDRIYHDDNMYI
jgi:hypothetical protein